MTYINKDDPSRVNPAANYSVPDLVAKLFREVSDLFRKEGELIRSEMSDKVSQLQVGLGKIAAGAIVLLVSLIVLAESLVQAIANIITRASSTPAANSAADLVSANEGWAALIVGILFAAVGAFLVRSGTTDLNVRNLTPDRTAQQVRRDTELAKEQIR
jgi:hypothetical protein